MLIAGSVISFFPMQSFLFENLVLIAIFFKGSHAIGALMTIIRPPAAAGMFCPADAVLADDYNGVLQRYLTFFGFTNPYSALNILKS